MIHKAWSDVEEVPYWSSRSSIKLQEHPGQKINDFDRIWMFSDCNSSFNSRMASKWCTILEGVEKRCPIFFRSSPKFKGHTGPKTTILTQIEHFWTVTPVWINRRVWNDAQRLKRHARGSLLFSRAICQILRLHWPKNEWFFGCGSDLSIITRPFTAIKSFRFALFLFGIFVFA